MPANMKLQASGWLRKPESKREKMASNPCKSVHISGFAGELWVKPLCLKYFSLAAPK
jgi:hypothetical protein